MPKSTISVSTITENSVNLLTAKAKSDILKALLHKLDALDAEDFFGTEGWRHRLFGED